MLRAWPTHSLARASLPTCLSTWPRWRRPTTRPPTRASPRSASASALSGHRGSSLDGAFNEAHILAITQAICDYRAAAGHRRAAVPRHRHARALRAGARDRARGPGGQRRRGDASQADDGYTPTPVISHAILDLQPRPARSALADGIVITPSHNPPRTAASSTTRPTAARPTPTITGWIQDARQRAARGGNRRREARAVRRRRCSRVHHASRTTTSRRYVERPRQRHRHGRDPRRAACRIGVDPLGGAARALLGADRRALRPRLTVVNDARRSALPFMTVDHDGKIRMDCSSARTRWPAWSALKDRFDVAFGNDTDADRHGIVTPQRRAAEPEPLPRRRDRLSVHAPPGLAAQTRPSARRWSAAA